MQKLLLFGFTFSETTISIAKVLHTLWADGNLILWGVVFTFSVGIPLAKVILEAILWYVVLSRGHATPRLSHAAEILSKLSMVEIFVVGVLVAVVKLNAWTAARPEVGIYLLLGSTLTGLWASFRISQEMKASGT